MKTKRPTPKAEKPGDVTLRYFRETVVRQDAALNAIRSALAKLEGRS